MKKRTVKKRTPIKRKKAKTAKPEAPAGSLSVEQDIAGLLTMLVQKLASFEKKIDMVLSRTMAPPAEAPRHPPAPVIVPQHRREPKPMYKAICADCRRDCEVPFRPSGERPVYCRECFARRKNNVFKKPEEKRPPEPPMPVQVPAAPAKKAKTAKTKKAPVKKKKPAAAKKKAVRRK